MGPVGGGTIPGVPEPQPVWVVWRQDDNGNRVEVARFDSRADAEALAAEFDARGHRQTYWVAADPRLSP
jgi:hypothetical protein